MTFRRALEMLQIFRERRARGEHECARLNIGRLFVVMEHAVGKNCASRYERHAVVWNPDYQWCEMNR